MTWGAAGRPPRRSHPEAQAGGFKQEGAWTGWGLYPCYAQDWHGLQTLSRDTPLMASANVDLVRSIYPAWASGDFGSAEWAHSEIEFVAADGAETGKAGLAATAEGAREFLSGWENFGIEADEYCELYDQRVLVLDHPQRARQDERTGPRAGADDWSTPVPHPRRQR